MCGIGGLIGACAGHAGAHGEIAAMMRALHHRGPDDNGTHIDTEARVALGHNRLSIIDLSADGHQPMVNPDTGDVLVFNGEIYNFLDLRAELEIRGVKFRSRSDTEVLLHAFAAWGLDCLARVEGMYAFALWRPAERALYLVRDPMGIKPLYWWRLPQGRGFAFASELKGLMALDGFAAAIDRRALGQFLELGYTFDDERTCLEGVRKLPPAHVLRLAPDTLDAAPRRYWTPNLEPVGADSEDRLCDELHHTLSLVTRQHLNADVPVALLLSGGLDSSILAALASRQAQVRTVSMGFADSNIDERPFARRVAGHLGTEHEEILITADDIKSGLADSVRHFDDLFADWGTISTRLLYAKCRERGLKVVIVGEGADELFGGYDIFRQGLSRAPQPWWLFQLYRRYAGRRHGRFLGPFAARMREHVRACGGDRFGAIRLFETRQQLPNNYVMKVDKASMSVSVEARVPYLDRRVAAIAYRAPAGMLISPSSEKLLLRRMAERAKLLPEETLQRRKVGGSIAADWMDSHADWRGFVQGIILDGGWTKELGLSAAMRAYFVENRQGFPFPHGISIFRNLAWRLLILELWARAYGVAPRVA